MPVGSDSRRAGMHGTISREGYEEPSTPAPLPSAPRFDIGTEPYTQATFKFTDDELYALDDLKRDLNRQRELKTTKQNLVRYAVHRLVEDYEQNGDESWLVQRLLVRNK